MRTILEVIYRSLDIFLSPVFWLLQTALTLCIGITAFCVLFYGAIFVIAPHHHFSTLRGVGVFVVGTLALVFAQIVLQAASGWVRSLPGRQFRMER
jgi:hypothetical protein